MQKSKIIYYHFDHYDQFDQIILAGKKKYSLNFIHSKIVLTPNFWMVVYVSHAVLEMTTIA